MIGRYDTLSTERQRTVDATVEKALENVEPQLVQIAESERPEEAWDSFGGGPLFTIGGLSLFAYHRLPELRREAKENFRDLFSYFLDPNFSLQQY